MICIALTGPWVYVPILLGYLLLVFAVWQINKQRHPRTTFWWGTWLVLFGVFGPLYASFAPALAQQPVHDFARDSFLIVAAIGGNLIASAVLKFEPSDRIFPERFYKKAKKVAAVTVTPAAAPLLVVPEVEQATNPAPGSTITGENADDTIGSPRQP